MSNRVLNPGQSEKIKLNFYLNPAIARFEQNLSSISLFYADYIYISTLYIGI